MQSQDNASSEGQCAMRIVGYCRRSKERANGFGLEAQEDAVRRWADYERADVVSIERDDDVSGITDPEAREGLSRALATLRAGGADALVVAKFDRLARSLIAFADVLKLSEAEGWQLIVLDPMLDLRTAAGRAMSMMLIAFADIEREAFTNRMRDGRRAKIARGGYSGGNRLARRYGFRLVASAGGGFEYEPIPDEQEIIAAIVDARSSGLSTRAVADQLNADGVAPPAGRQWYHSAVGRVTRAAERMAVAA